MHHARLTISHCYTRRLSVWQSEQRREPSVQQWKVGSAQFISARYERSDYTKSRSLVAALLGMPGVYCRTIGTATDFANVLLFNPDTFFALSMAMPYSSSLMRLAATTVCGIAFTALKMLMPVGPLD